MSFDAVSKQIELELHNSAPGVTHFSLDAHSHVLIYLNVPKSLL